MAKRKNNLASSSHHFFMLVVLSVSALGLMLFTYASQQKTSTQSDASEIAAKCRKHPTLTSSGTNFGTNFVTYIYKVGFPSGGCKTIDYGLSMSVPNSNWQVEYKLNNNAWVTFAPFLQRKGLKSGMTDTVRVKVKPPAGASSKTYYLKAKACALYGEVDAPFMSLNPDECITKTATYVKD